MARANPISSRPARHVAHLLDPGDGAVETLQVVLVGGGELTRQVRELELDQVADLTELGQLVADLLLGAGDLGPAPEGLRSCAEPGHVWHEGCKCPLFVNHETIIRTFVCRSIVCAVNFQKHENKACLEPPVPAHQTRFQSPGPAQTPSSQSFFGPRTYESRMCFPFPAFISRLT